MSVDRMRVLLAIVLVSFSAMQTPAQSAQARHDAVNAPGPSAVLFAHPYYRCVKNYYVATTGSDANDGSSPANAWADLAACQRYAARRRPGGGFLHQCRAWDL